MLQQRAPIRLLQTRAARETDMSNAPGQLSIGLLGPLSACLKGRSVVPSAAKQRQVLALLALNAGRIVTISTFIDELWGDHPPRSYATTLQTYILQLRNALTDAQPDNPAVRAFLGTRHSGYILEADAYQTDIDEFFRFARSGRIAAETGDHLTASEQLGHALNLWRGPALVDVRIGRVLELEAASLEQTRLGVFERRVEADLMLGRQMDLLGELTLAAAKNPMNENLCAFLMIALYRSGHVGRSLESFARLRSVLHTELGVEPCPRLQRLHKAILSGNPALDSESWSMTSHGAGISQGWAGLAEGAPRHDIRQRHSHGIKSITDSGTCGRRARGGTAIGYAEYPPRRGRCDGPRRACRAH
jgi:SARP family transcriptional regulator, regulator of embCAB operon